MVLQETWIFSGTIRENIAYGKPNATDEEIKEAARLSGADDFINKLTYGYATRITEDGGNLSAGQKQLLCIARVMLIKPPMLILDEATSNIDTRTELKIQNAFNTLMQNRTTFIVAHRLSTIQNADQILVMNKGNAEILAPKREVFAQGERLEKMGLRVPQITKITQLLQKKGIDLPDGRLSSLNRILLLYIIRWISVTRRWKKSPFVPSHQRAVCSW